MVSYIVLEQRRVCLNENGEGALWGEGSLVRSHYLLVKGRSQPSPKPLRGSRRLRSASLLRSLPEAPHLLNQTGSQWSKGALWYMPDHQSHWAQRWVRCFWKKNRRYTNSMQYYTWLMNISSYNESTKIKQDNTYLPGLSWENIILLLCCIFKCQLTLENFFFCIVDTNTQIYQLKNSI